MNILHRPIEWFKRRHARRQEEKARKEADRVRHIPDEYLSACYRRLAPTRADVIGEHCWNCRHAVAYERWHCDLRADYRGRDCKWERCYVADEITPADLRAGLKDVGGWIGLPPNPPKSE